MDGLLKLIDISEFLDLLPSFVWIAKDREEVSYVNSCFTEYTGLGLDDVQGDRWKQIVHPHDLSYAESIWNRMMETGCAVELEYRIRDKNGAYAWWLEKIRPLKNGGTVVAWIACVTKIDEQKRLQFELENAKEALVAKQNLLEAVLDQLPVSVLAAHSPNGEIFMRNAAFRKYFEVHELRSINEYSDKYRAFHSDGNAYRNEDWPLARCIVNGETIVDEDINVQYIQGQLGVMRCNSRPVYDSKGKVTAAVLICEDITDKLRLEQETIELKAREAAAIQASKMKSEFMACVSHEMRTPLNGILGMAEVLVGDVQLDDHQKSEIEIILDSGRTLLTVINDILDFSRVEAGKLKLDRVPFSLKQVLSNCECLSRRSALENGLELKLEQVGEIPNAVFGDPCRIQQIVLNLLTNSIKFTERGSITLKASGTTTDNKFQAVISVKDTGIGMSNDTLAKIFKPFTQADTSTTRKYGGSGLGLSICKKLTELLNGEITVKSDLGKGSEFTVTLDFDICQNDVQPVSTISARQVAPDTRILVAEDNAINQRVIIRLLEQLGYKNCRVATDGKQAVNAVQQEHFDVILMDCHMPELDGFQATQLIRNLGFNKLPIIAVSASATDEDVQACFSCGMSGHLAKPVSSSSLEDTLNRYLLR